MIVAQEAPSRHVVGRSACSVRARQKSSRYCPGVEDQHQTVWFSTRVLLGDVFGDDVAVLPLVYRFIVLGVVTKKK